MTQWNTPWRHICDRQLRDTNAMSGVSSFFSFDEIIASDGRIASLPGRYFVRTVTSSRMLTARWNDNVLFWKSIHDCQKLHIH